MKNIFTPLRSAPPLERGGKNKIREKYFLHIFINLDKNSVYGDARTYAVCYDPTKWPRMPIGGAQATFGQKWPILLHFAPT